MANSDNMTKPLLNFIAKAPFDATYDPLLGRNVVDANENEQFEAEITKTGSVFDDPDLDFAYVAPVASAAATADIETIVEDREVNLETVLSESESAVNEPEPEPVFVDEPLQDEISDVDFTNQSEIPSETIETTTTENSTNFQTAETEELEPTLSEGALIEEVQPNNEDNSDFQIEENTHTPTLENEKSEVLEDLFAPKPEKQSNNVVFDLFGPIFKSGRIKIRNLGPILGGKSDKVLNVGPILAGGAEKTQTSDTNPIFAEPIFGQKPEDNAIESDVFDGPIFGKRKSIENENGLSSSFVENDEARTEVEPPAQPESEQDEHLVEENPETLQSSEILEQPSDMENTETAAEDLLIDETSQIEAQDVEDNSIDAQISPETEIAVEAPSESPEAPTNDEPEALNGDFSSDEHQVQENAQDDKTSPEGGSDTSIGADETDEAIKTRGDILREKYEQAKRKENRQKVRAKALKANKKKKPFNPLAFFAAVSTTGTFAILSTAALLAPLGPPFDAISFGNWYIATLGFIGVLTWLYMRYWAMGAITAVLLLINLMSFVPTLGSAPKGGKADRVIGWVDLNYSGAAFDKAIQAAENNKTDILLMARANLTRVPANWSLLQAPIRNDPNSITILSKGNWAAATLVGEPTMARLVDNSITIIAVNPLDPSRQKERQAERESMINRAAARTGTQETPVIAIGSFDEPSWSRQMVGFAQNGLVKRVRCGGYFGSTVNNGLFNLAPDHVFARGLIVSKCNIGGALPGGAHRPLWISVRADESLNKAASQ